MRSIIHTRVESTPYKMYDADRQPRPKKSNDTVQQWITGDNVTMCSPMGGANQTIMRAAPVVPHCKANANDEAMNIRENAELSKPHLCLGQ